MKKMLLVLFAAMMLLSGCGSLDEGDLVQCDDCGSRISEVYTVRFGGQRLCPGCIEEMLDLTGEIEICSFCGEAAPAQYYIEVYEDRRCPRCIRNDILTITSDDVGKCYMCNDFYFTSDSRGLGICFSCGQSKVTMCNGCDMPVLPWPGNEGFSFCHVCMGQAMEDERVENAFRSYWEE